MRCWKRYAGARRQASAPCVAGARGVCASARDARQAGLRRLGRLSTRDCTSAYGRAVSGCAAGMLGGMCSGARSVRATGSASFAMCCGRGRAAAAAVPVRAASLARPLSVGCARATAALAHASGRSTGCRARNRSADDLMGERAMEARTVLGVQQRDEAGRGVRPDGSRACRRPAPRAPTRRARSHRYLD